MIELLFLTPLFLCWGSFLNMLAYRLIRFKSIWIKRSFCPKCKKTIYWYDNIPIISYVLLQAKCRFCKTHISFLYPFIEIFTAITMLALYYTVDITYFFPYFIFFSALIITFRTDVEFMLISRFTTLFLIPLGFLFSAVGLLPITLLNSLLGVIIGYGSLYLASKACLYLTGKQGMGQGDLELLAFIGSFLGVSGCWISLVLGSILGSIFGLIYMAITKQTRSVKMPFGHFLAIGAISFVLFERYLISILLGIS